MDNPKLEKFIFLLNHLFEMLKDNMKKNMSIKNYISSKFNFDINDLSILIVNINNIMNIGRDTSIYQIFKLNIDKLYPFLNRVFKKITSEIPQINYEHIILKDDIIYFEDNIIEDIRDNVLKEEIKLLFIKLPKLNDELSINGMTIILKYGLYEDYSN